MDSQPRIEDILPPDMRERLNAARIDPKAFAVERDDLATCWTFLGFEHQLANVNDWFRSVLGGRSVVVHKFDRGIFAFENKCAHRGYPLRHEDKGNGPLICGFHHWRYNHEGLALGIPNCVDMYGMQPRQLDARLKPVELAQAGGMIFGRFADPDGPTLEAWLGAAFPILKHVSTFTDRPTATVEYDVGAHWRFIHEITLDDYHIVAIHPSTFGKNGYIPVDGIRYDQIAAHSMYFRAGDAQSLQAMVEQCQAGELMPGRYRIIQIFPGLVISMVQALSYLGEGYWYAMVMHILPVAHDRSKVVVRSFRMPQPATVQAWRRLARWLAWPSIDRVFNFYARRVQTEDNVACEHLQRYAAANDPPPKLARHEERIGWFEEAYALAVTGVRKGPFRWPG